LPVAGIAAAVLFTVYAIAGGSPPGPDASAANQVTWYASHDTRVIISGFAGGLFMIAMAFFATGIRQALRSGESSESTYSSVAYAGGLLAGFAVALWGWIGYAAAQAAHDHQDTVVHTLGYLTAVGWLPWVAATAVLMLGAGLGGLRTAALPKWLAIVTVVLGAVAVIGPAGIAVYFVMPFWLAATGIALVRRMSQADSRPTAIGSPGRKVESR
jgi:hypothetical protein